MLLLLNIIFSMMPMMIGGEEEEILSGHFCPYIITGHLNDDHLRFCRSTHPSQLSLHVPQFSSPHDLLTHHHLSEKNSGRPLDAPVSPAATDSDDSVPQNNIMILMFALTPMHVSLSLNYRKIQGKRERMNLINL